MDHLRIAVRANDLAGTLEHLYGNYGPVVDFGFKFPLRMVCLFGPEANQHILADNAANFTWREAFRLLEVVDGPTALAIRNAQVVPRTFLGRHGRNMTGHTQLSVVVDIIAFG